MPRYLERVFPRDAHVGLHHPQGKRVEKAREVNRVQKTLEETNIKWGDVVSDMMGKASRMILQAIADGESDPGRLASLAVGKVRADQEQVEAALNGKITDHHRFLLSEHLTQIHHLVNPDAWLSRVKGQHLVRRVNRQGFVKVDLYPYYISSKLAGQR